MSQADFTLHYRRLILGGVLVALSGVGMGSIVSNTVQAQSVTLPSEQLNSTRTESAPESQIASSGSLIIASQNKAQESTIQEGAQLASTTTTATTTTQEVSGEVVSDSMIKPSRPNGLLYKDSAQEDAQEATTATTNSLVEGVVSEEESKISEIVIYFSASEDVRGQDVDSLTGASLITKDGMQQGITEYVAQYIGQRQEIPVFKLTLEEDYPSEHEALIERSYAELSLIKEQSTNLKAQLTPEVDLSKVERIYLGFPLWWNDLPLPVYAFLKQEDLSGKTILPFCTYGHNTPYQLFKRLSELEPNAKIIRGIDLNKQRLVKGMLDKSLERWIDDNALKDSSSSSTKSNSSNINNSSTSNLGTNSTISTNTTSGTVNSSSSSGVTPTVQVSSQAN